MPKFDFECPKCNKIVEIEVVSTNAIESKRIVRRKCKTCGAYMKKLISKPAIRFKGSGFYKTDSERK